MNPPHIRTIIQQHMHISFIFFLISSCLATPTFGQAVEHRIVREEGLTATYYYGPNRPQQPSIIMFGGSSGGNFYNKYQNYMEDLVVKGYAVLSLAYFDYDGKGKLPNMLRHIPLEYFEKAMNWMERQPETINGRFALIGNSRGGEAALLLATQYPKISTVVAIVPSAYVGGAYDNKKEVSGSAWTLCGEEIPYVDYQKAIAKYNPWWKIIDNIEEVEQFAIPVEKMSAAVLLLSGTKDKIWPSTEMSNRVIRRLKRHHYPFPYEHIAYDAGHDIRMKSWPDVMRFLATNYSVD